MAKVAIVKQLFFPITIPYFLYSPHPMQYQVLWLWLQNKSPVSSLLNISSTNYYYRAFAGDVVVKNQPVNAGDAGDLGSIFGLGRSPGIGNGNPIQYSCLDNSMDRGTW